MNDWQPSASIKALQQRAKIIANIRAFFATRGVLEVETPSLSSATVTDVHLEAFTSRFAADQSAANKLMYLQTSPEYSMKRLLAAGSGAIFQISKAFRNEAKGRFHNPEFTMLEWYRPGYDHFKLMAEVSELVSNILQTEPAKQISYQQVFTDTLGIDPLATTLTELKECTVKHQLTGDWIAAEQSIDTLLQFLFALLIEPAIAKKQPYLVYDFPASQASLAKISSQDNRVAERFELYYQGIELANGFHELTNANEQRQRFANDNIARQELGLKEKPIDENLLSALAHGLPECSGVALGVDRLIMLALNECNISNVIAFDIDHA